MICTTWTNEKETEEMKKDALVWMQEKGYVDGC
jgi:hypothetical protein